MTAAPISWDAVAGTAVIGLIIFAHLIWCLKRGRYVARLVRVERAEEPLTFWFFIALSVLLVSILWGGTVAMLVNNWKTA